jgi:hypothetical protein
MNVNIVAPDGMLLASSSTLTSLGWEIHKLKASLQSKCNVCVQIGDSHGVSYGRVDSFEVEVSIKVNNTIGPEYDDSNALTWQGRTQVKLNVTWTDPSSRPWVDTTFMLSTQVLPSLSTAAGSSLAYNGCSCCSWGS